MANRIGTIEVRRQRGKLTVQGLGKTNRGQRFIQQTVEIDAKSMADKEFKEQMAAAVKQILP